MASGYQYTPLPVDGSSIRLLKLLPSATPSSIIECEILTTSLTDPSTLIPYEALSYTWGAAHPTTEIKLNGHPFAATLNLGAALRALRHSDTPRVLWVDAVCIDQRNIPEQGAQVRMMWDIYRAAACVVVWLGPEERNSAVAMADFARRETQTRLALRQRPMDEPRDSSDARWCGCHAGDFETMPPRIGVQNLLGRRWFTRVWVLQEVAAAKRVVVACGSSTVDGGDFCREILGVASFSTSFNKILRKIRPAVQLMDSSYSGLHRGQLPLLELIETYRSWDATKAVDKVYSLLAFSSDGNAVPELQPDYSLPPHILAQRIIQ
ncbi:heterokaryon incompatibility protein-domain-containing protein, partial [Podospora appendiculata]